MGLSFNSLFLKVIDLSIFLRFNKIRLLTNSLRELGEALSKSDLIELNEDRTMIKRKIPFIEPSQKHMDKRTIYVVRSLIFKIFI